MTLITATELSVIANDTTAAFHLRNAARHLAQVITDWPDKVETLADFEQQVIALAGTDVTHDAITAYLNTVDYRNEGWYAESMERLGKLLGPKRAQSPTLRDLIGCLAAWHAQPRRGANL